MVHHNRLLISWLIWWVVVKAGQLIYRPTLLICLTLVLPDHDGSALYRPLGRAIELQRYVSPMGR
jgi:hypothetical protein